MMAYRDLMAVPLLYSKNPESNARIKNTAPKINNPYLGAPP